MQKQLIEFYYKWDRFEKKNNVDIIDFDLIQQGNENLGEFNSREDVLNHLEKLVKEYKQVGIKDPFIEAKLQASLYYLKALMGQKIPFRQYVEKTMGITPRNIPENILVEQTNKLRELYKQVGYSWNKKGILKFRKDNLIAKDKIEKSFIKFRDMVVPQVMIWLGLNFELKYRTSFVDLDVYWMNWISTDADGEIHLKYNLNKRHKWIRGSTEFLVFHEICAHAIQANSWKDSIQRGKITPFAGLTTVFTTEQFFMEGIAESLFYFYPTNPFSTFGLIHVYFNHLYWLVWNNAHIMANKNKDLKTIIGFVQEYLPHLSEKEIKKEIDERTLHPLFRTYQYIYGIATYYHKLLSEKLSAEEKRNYVLDIFTHTFLPEDITKRYALT